MKTVSEIMLPEDVLYTKEHVWVRKDGDGWCAGITDFAQDQLGEVVFIDLPLPRACLAAGNEFGTVESVKSVNALYMPVGGTMAEINTELENSPALVNIDCYGKGWMIRFHTVAGETMQGLLSAAVYRESISI